jgi:hypothetical protein
MMGLAALDPSYGPVAEFEPIESADEVVMAGLVPAIHVF